LPFGGHLDSRYFCPITRLTEERNSFLYFWQ